MIDEFLDRFVVVGGGLLALVEVEKASMFLTGLRTRCCTSNKTRSGNGPKKRRCRECLSGDWPNCAGGVNIDRRVVPLRSCSGNDITPSRVAYFPHADE